MSQKSLLESWRKSSTRRAELTALMQEPAMVDAIAIIKEQLYDLKPLPLGGNYDLMDYYALYGAKQAGYIEALTNLFSLAELTFAKSPDRKPWDTVNKDKLAEKLSLEMGPIEPPEDQPS